MLVRYYDSMLKNHDLLDAFRLFDDFYKTPLSLKTKTVSTAAYRLDTKDDVLTLSVDLPGVKSKDLSVQATGRDVKIVGKIRGEDFVYTYSIPKEYDPESIEASTEDGVLSLKFAKFAKETTRTIEVKVK
jgi:HSP20 family molecular chaperone IbpA